VNSKLKVFAIGCAVAAAASLGAGAAHASSVWDKITSVSVTGTNFTVIIMGSAPSSRPGCHTGPTQAYAFDISTTKGKALLSLAQAGYLSKNNTIATGGTTCTTVGTNVIETLQSLELR
jgi:hypothetical protein